MRWVNVQKKILKVGKFYRLIQDEFNSPIRIPLKDAIWSWSHGFLRESFVMYGLNNDNVMNYLNDYDRFLKAPFINEPFGYVLDNKLILDRILRNEFNVLPKTFCFLIDADTILPLDQENHVDTFEDILGLCKSGRNLVLKPQDGAGGKGVHFLKWYQGEYYLDLIKISSDGLFALFRGLNNYLINEQVVQANYASKISPESINTLRIITMWDYKNWEPFIAVAIHRFGSNKTAPVDNFTRGGYSCKVDLDTGRLGKAAKYPHNSRLEWLSHHPDTEQRIEGVQVENWEIVKNGLLSLAKEVNYIPYIGWDVVITSEGFSVLEANNNPDTDITQLHSMFLDLLNVRDFFQYHGVLKYAKNN